MTNLTIKLVGILVGIFNKKRKKRSFTLFIHENVDVTEKYSAVQDKTKVLHHVDKISRCTTSLLLLVVFRLFQDPTQG